MKKGNKKNGMEFDLWSTMRKSIMTISIAVKTCYHLLSIHPYLINAYKNLMT